MRKELSLGDEIYYTIEDYNTGKDIIYKGYVVGYNDNQKLKLDNDYIKLGRFYEISDREDGKMIVGMQRNCLYTIEDLFDIKNMYEEIPYHIIKGLEDKDNIKYNRLYEIASKLIEYVFMNNGDMSIFYKNIGISYEEFSKLYPKEE